ncbi:MAG: hypothetical protein VW985_07750 [Gammaproteobacteria bacterium]
MLFDHSPTALLAARGLQIPKICLGNGFLIPAGESPWQPLVESTEPLTEQLTQWDAAILQSARGVTDYFGEPALERVSRLYDADIYWLDTFVELDPFARFRSDPVYLGSYPGMDGAPPRWPDDNKPKIFAYLSPGPDLIKQLTGLIAGGGSVLAYIRGLSRDSFSQLPNDLTIADERINMVEAVGTSDLVACLGTHNTMCHALLGGTPIVAIPNNLERKLHSNRVVSLAAGLSCLPDDLGNLGERVKRVLNEPEFTAGARRFQEKYKPAGAAQSLEIQLSQAENLLNR